MILPRGIGTKGRGVWVSLFRFQFPSLKGIPSSTQITEEEIKYVADKVKELLRSLANG